MTTQRPLHFVVPEGLAARTGGFAYDRRVIAGLRARGLDVVVHELGAGFPWPSDRVLAAAADALRAVPTGDAVVIDGLALGGMPDVVCAESDRLRLIGLVHHPLALETGLDAGRSRVLFAGERCALSAVARVIATSRSTARALADYGVEPGAVTVAEPGTDRAPLAACRGTPPLRLLCVGTVTPRKGHALLLEALAGLRDRSWYLDCVGSTTRDPGTADAVGERVAALDLEDRVRLHGEVDDAVLARAYAEADAFVLASYYEGYGMAFAEALARGLPVVATAGGAVADTVPAAAGLLSGPGDVMALRNGLRRLLDEPGLYERLRLGARAARANLPRWEHTVDCFAAGLSSGVSA